MHARRFGYLIELAVSGGEASSAPSLIYRWKDNGRKHSYDSDDHQKFDESEPRTQLFSIH